MNDGDIRALQVKMLSEDQLRALHRDEEVRALSPLGIREMFKLQQIKEYYRVTASPIRSGRVTSRILHEWGERVRAVMERFCRDNSVEHSGELEKLHAYDWAVWRSDLDFYFKTATFAKKAWTPSRTWMDDGAKS